MTRSRSTSLFSTRGFAQQTTAAHIPKRQAEEITVRAAQDVDTFYAKREVAANDTALATGHVH